MLIKFMKSLGRISPLMEPTVRHYAVYARAFWRVKVRRKLQVLESEHALKETVRHNLKSIYGINNRMNLLTFPVSVIETAGPNSKILVIGPRNENDLLSLVALGYKRENVFGLDLITYSDWIKLGDMHDIPFPDNTFDVVICGWTISYSVNPKQAAAEMVRVAKPGGLIAVGVEYSTMTSEDEKSMVGYELQEFDKQKRLNSTDDLKQLFVGNIDTIYFEHDAPRKVSHTAVLVPRVSNVAVVFSTPGGDPTSLPD